MSTYAMVGAAKDTGNEVQIMLNANDAKEAEAKANYLGLLVSNIKPVKRSSLLPVALGVIGVLMMAGAFWGDEQNMHERNNIHATTAIDRNMRTPTVTDRLDDLQQTTKENAADEGIRIRGYFGFTLFLSAFVVARIK